jgi:methionyl-tRNA formyltransferase
MNYIIAFSKNWNYYHHDINLSHKDSKWFFFTKKDQLSIENISQINPRYIFFPHWSYIIPEEIYSNFECVIFHMTDVPFGRGGSPLQNLIARGIYETKLTALKCTKEIDAGPVYTKRELSLHGNAEEIYIRTNKLCFDIIKWIVETEPSPTKQTGEAVLFPRRSPQEGEISHLKTLTQIFDYIRMLDAEGYPPAFLTTDCFKFEFSRASLKKDQILADVRITMRNKNDKNK